MLTTSGPGRTAHRQLSSPSGLVGRTLQGPTNWMAAGRPPSVCGKSRSSPACSKPRTTHARIFLRYAELHGSTLDIDDAVRARIRRHEGIVVAEGRHAELWLDDSGVVNSRLRMGDTRGKSAVHGADARNVITRARRRSVRAHWPMEDDG